MTIWHVLVGVCFAVPFGTAWRAAESANASKGGYLLAMLVASIIGTSCALFMHFVHQRLMAMFEHSPRDLFRRFLIVLFAAECAWIGAAGYAAWRTAAALFHQMH